MAERTPLVLVGGAQQQVQVADVVARAALGTGVPDATKYLRGDSTWQVPPGGASGEPWEGKLHCAWGNGCPTQHDALWGFQNTAVSVAGPTPTGITTTIGRLALMRFKTAITVANVRWFGLATVTSAYTGAIYNATTNARMWMLDPWNTAAGWGVSAAAFTLAADTPYWLGLGAKTTGTTAGFRSPASPIATNSLGLVTIPGNLANYGPRYAQVALTAGLWPATLPALATAAFASAGTTGTLPVVFLDAT